MHGKPDNLHDLIHSASLDNLCAQTFCTTCGSRPFIEKIRKYIGGYRNRVLRQDVFIYGNLFDESEAYKILDDLKYVRPIGRHNQEIFIRFILVEVWMALGRAGCEPKMQEILQQSYAGNILEKMIIHSQDLARKRHEHNIRNSPEEKARREKIRQQKIAEKLEKRSIIKAEIDRKYRESKNFNM